MDAVLHHPRVVGPQPMKAGTGGVAAAADFIDLTLQNEGAWYRADDVEARLGGLLASYGSSVGAVRGTIRDALRKFKDLDHDGIVQLASALWGQPRPGRGRYSSGGWPPWCCCRPGPGCCGTRT